MSARDDHRRGFTLVELLIVIGIIGLLIAILLPVLGAVRRAGRATACLANLQDWGRSYQMYLNANGGKSFLSPKDLTGQAWFELLQPYNGDVSRTLLCQDATEPGNMIGSSSLAWGPTRTYVIAAPQWQVRGTFVGSYGFNAWLWRTPPGQVMPPEFAGRMIDLPAAHSDSVPVLADCIAEQGMPLETDTAPSNLEHPLPVSGSGVPGPRGQMAYFCIDRHGRAVNVLFLDGHAARVPLSELWKLQWHRGFEKREITGLP